MNARASSSDTGRSKPCKTGTLGSNSGRTGATLVAKQFQMLGMRADEYDARRRATARETRALGQKAVAGMDRGAASRLGGFDDRLLVEVRRRAFASERVGLVGNAVVQAGGVVLGVRRRRYASLDQPRHGRFGWRFRRGWRSANF